MFNTITHIDRFVHKLILKNPNRSYSGLFKLMRGKVPLIGDYVILVHIARLLADDGIKLTKSQVYTALKYSRDYKEANDKGIWNKDIMRINKKNLTEINIKRRVRRPKVKTAD